MEFALLLPIFMMLILGMFSGGIAYNRNLDIAHAAREGARYAATFSTESQTPSAWATRVRNIVKERSSENLADSNVCVALVNGTAGGTTVTTAAGSWSAVPAGFPANCFSDNNADGSQRVHVMVKSSARLEALVFTRTIPLAAKGVALYEPPPPA